MLSKANGGIRTRVVILFLVAYTVLLYIVFTSMSKTSVGIVVQDRYNNPSPPVAEDASQKQQPEIAPQGQAEQEEANVNDNQNNESSERDRCDTTSVSRNVDPNHTQAHLSWWQNLDSATIDMYRRAWQSFLASDKTKMVGKGRGIVFVAGNRDTFARALTSIKLLRQYGCALPVEIWHLPDEQPDEEQARELQDVGAVARDLAEQSLPRRIDHRRDADKQFQIKAASIINSDFEEVLYLDSDNAPSRDPTFLFDSPNYKRTGALFWPDFWKTHAENKIFDVLNVPCRDEWEQEVCAAIMCACIYLD